MREVFRVVEPDPSNAAAYGHEIRHLLTLACIEFEAGCKAVLRANAYPARQSWNSLDYFRLVAPMRLSSYSLNLVRYPLWPEMRPFDDWTADKGPAWYRAYNAAKHDREADAPAARFDAMITAMAAVYALVIAQFGVVAPKTNFGVTEYFDFGLAAFPRWNDEEGYLSPTVEPAPDQPGRTSKPFFLP